MPNIAVMRVLCNDFSLKHTLDSGQFFRYDVHEGWHYLMTRDKVFRARQQGNQLEFEGASARFVKHFFGLDEDYVRIEGILGKDAVLRNAFKKYHGLRIIRQDPWECTIGFLCSQFSNIKKIKGNLNCIAALFGRPVVFKGRLFFTFPKPGEINDASRLKKCAVGFRAKYILGVNSFVDDDWFSRLKKLSYEKAKQKLVELPGIGEKVADCILLFSLGKTEAFPVDVWMERVMKENYFSGKKLPLKKIAVLGRERWGKHAGYAQQYLYHWRRLHN
jgi:N-glycosylase/DNA lyase